MPRITVGIRIKPEDENNIIKSFQHSMKTGGSCSESVEITANGLKHEFLFDYVFGMASSQADIFEKCARSVVDTVLDGYNGTLFAYGQTGAGKTHTVTGPQLESYEERGLCLRTVDHIFQCVRRFKEREFVVKISVIEIYNDHVIDLLREQGKSDVNEHKLIVMDTPDGVVIPALYQFPAETEDEAYTKISEANINRAVAEHQMNRRSSRSHCIYSFYITQSPSVSKTSDGSDVAQSKLHIVDLAGSERIEKTGSTGSLIKEAAHINKSLSFLEQVVQSLAKQTSGLGSTVVASYRQSKLTYILKDSLGGNCNTLLIGCIWPHKNHVWETLSTLRFATRMKCIENHPKRNSLITGNGASSSTRSLQVTIEALKKELAIRDSIHAYSRHYLQGVNGTGNGVLIESLNSPMPGEGENNRNQRRVYTEALTAQQQNTTVRMACDYAIQGSVELSLPVPNNFDAASCLEINSLAQAQVVIATLRCALWQGCGGNASAVMGVLEKVKSSCIGDSSVRSQNPAKQLSSSISCGSSVTVERNEVVTTPPKIESFNSYDKLNDDAIDVNNSKDSGNELESSSLKKQSLTPIESSDSSPSRDGHNSDIVKNTNIESSNAAPTMDPFEHFKQREGATHHSAYEEAKTKLKDLKALQKKLVLAVNCAKTEIDKLTEQISELNSEQISSLRERSAPEIASLKGDLSEVKKRYRTKRSELLNVKEDLAATTLRKQQLLKELVLAYEAFSGKI